MLRFAKQLKMVKCSYYWLIAVTVFIRESLGNDDGDRGCSVSADFNTCVATVHCVSYVDDLQSKYAELFRNRNYGYDYPQCDHLYGNSYSYDFETHLFLRQADESTSFFTYKYIVTLDLRGNSFKNMPEMRYLERLSTLNLAENDLTSAWLSSSTNLSALQNVDYSHNKIEKIEVNKEKFMFRSLQKLNLSYNYLEQIPNLAFESISSLKVIDLSHNHIAVIDLLTFEGLKNLEFFNMSNNRVSGISTALFRFTKLVELDMSYNKLYKISENNLQYLVHLQKLDLSFNSLMNINGTAFFKNDLLKVIDISGNNMQNLDKDLFSKTVNIEYVNISKNKIKHLQKFLFKEKEIKNFSVRDNLLEGILEGGLFDGLYVSQLDLSYQHFDYIDDLAFLELKNLSVLLLNDNAIQTISEKAFYSLQTLIELDLSNNRLVDIKFDKKDLYGLQILSLSYNTITQFTNESLRGLNALQYLDISNNNISKLDSYTFSSQRNLISLKIDKNPLTGLLYENSFEGLISLPTLDISGCSFSKINNNTFNGMNQLKILNSSSSHIKELLYNSFVNTSSLETIDLSNNYLEELDVNITELRNLKSLILYKNLLTTISDHMFSGLNRLINLDVSFNKINSIDNFAFRDQTDLRYLDLSYNIGLNFNDMSISHCQNLYSLKLSGADDKLKFSQNLNLQLKLLQITESRIHNISYINFKWLTLLENINLQRNYISNVTITAFPHMNFLSILDLSFNKISFMQPGCLKDTVLNTLNVSHNFISVLNYGMFRGLIYLKNLDISYNHIKKLKSEQFFEVQSLQLLIADHNSIDYIDPEDLDSLHLLSLSIGDNPLPCEMLIKLKDKRPNLELTAIILNETSNNNVFGVTCIIDQNSLKPLSLHNDTHAVLNNIREILLNLSNKITLVDQTPGNGYPMESEVNDKFISFLNNSLLFLEENFITKLLNANDKTLSLMKYEVSKSYERNKQVFEDLIATGNLTNTILDKIRLSSLNNKEIKPIKIISDDEHVNITVLKYIDKIKYELKNYIETEKQIISSTIDKKIAVSAQNISTSANVLPQYSEPKSILFIEMCVGFIFFIVLCFAVYKFYKSRFFMRTRRSFSNQQIFGSISNIDL